MAHRTLARRLAGGVMLGAAIGALYGTRVHISLGLQDVSLTAWTDVLQRTFGPLSWRLRLVISALAGAVIGGDAVLLAVALRMDRADAADEALRWTAAVFLKKPWNVPGIAVVLLTAAIAGAPYLEGSSAMPAFLIALLVAVGFLRRDRLTLPPGRFVPDFRGPGCEPFMLALIVLVSAFFVPVYFHRWAAVLLLYVPLVVVILLVDASEDPLDATRSILSWRVLSGWIVLWVRGLAWLQVLFLPIFVVYGYRWKLFTIPFTLMLSLGYVGGVLAAGRFAVTARPLPPSALES